MAQFFFQRPVGRRRTKDDQRPARPNPIALLLSHLRAPRAVVRPAGVHQALVPPVRRAVDEKLICDIGRGALPLGDCPAADTPADNRMETLVHRSL